MIQKISKTAAGLATGTAFLGSCCALPLLLTALGVGSFGLANALVPFQPYLTLATVVLLGSAFYLVYGRKKACAENQACDVKSIRRTKVLLWTAAGLALLFLIGPSLLARLLF